MRSQLELSNDLAAALAADQDALLRALERQLGGEVFLRGNRLTIDGEADAVEDGRRTIEELERLSERGHGLSEATIASVRGELNAERSPAQLLDDVVWTHRGRRIAPKTVGQKHYVDAIRANTITFGIGPAGTGKTFLAVAAAAAALSRREVNRIILTRPAVEAGERLGFLPGDLMAKVDPYLRPLFDALNDMLDPERVSQHIERGVIEIAPLAFMRGRAQPLSSRVLTPSGFKAIGRLRVGDLVVGSDGLPTPVIGVYPQGRKEVVTVRAQDGSATRCCLEHLWQVRTAADRRRGRAGRVMETREMLGRLRAAHQRRYELPLLHAPVEFPSRELPLDAYALGLLLGDGCLTTKTTPSFSTNDPELVAALEQALEGIEVRYKSDANYILRHRHGGRGGLRVANPVTVALRELKLEGTRSHTKFVPEPYLYNNSAVRLALLQGLLDADGGPVTQRGRTCRIQYTTCSERLRDDVVFIVRSLGGVAYWRIRRAAGRPPGFARGRPVYHRFDAYVLDIRLPSWAEPFRLHRKCDAYRRDGAGRPMRFVDAIEPDGVEETVCIQVAAADSLYVTDDFLLTHNSLNDSFIILDEAQNTTPEQMKMFLTRLGFGSRMVVTGDVTQVDLPRDQQSGLIVVGDILAEVEGVEFVTFSGKDVVRHRLVQRIVEAYDGHALRSTTDLGAKRARPH